MAKNQNGTLEMFLRNTASKIGAEGPFCVVMGNEAADLDSMASAVTYAWYLAQSSGGETRTVVPLIPIHRADFKLRTEAVYLFHEAGIDEASLVFLEDLDLHALHAKGALSLVLVDHNKLGKAFAEYAGAVEGILDHHQNENLYPQAAQRSIEAVGSTTTLAAERILRDARPKVDQGVAVLLAGTILLDTVNLDPKAGRVTPKDAEMAAALLPLAGKAQNELFDKLQYEKFNVSALSSFDILRKDYKEYALGDIRYGMSSALLSLAAWEKKDPNLAAEFAQYAKAMKLSLLVVMNAYTEPKFTRELVLYSSDSDLLRKLRAKLGGTDLGLSPLEPPQGSPAHHYAWYAQANESYSRKKLQPLIHELL